MKNLLIAASLAFAFAATSFAGEAKTEKTSAKDIVAIAAGNDQFTTLVAALKAADLVSVLQGEGPFTVFAPTDDAFAKLPEGTLESLLKTENKAKLQKILKYHVVAAKVMAADVEAGEVATVAGDKVTIKVADGKVHVDGAKVIMTDIVAKNGVIHVIDSVLLPN